MNVIIKSNNNLSRVFAAAETETIETLCGHDDVLEFFDAESAEDVLENLCDYQGIALPTSGDAAAVSAADSMRAALRTSVLLPDAVLTFDLEAVEDDEMDGVDAVEPADDTPADGTDGIVTVSTGGGMQTTNVSIINGRTTVYDAVFNDMVRAHSGMSDAQLSNCVVTVGDSQLSADMMRLQRVHNGDVIYLSPRAASTKGDK